jgi:hypothetical protein
VEGMAKKYNASDIGIAILFLVLNIFLMLYNKSIYHSSYLGYLIVLLFVCFSAFNTSRKNYKILIIVMLLNFLAAVLIDALKLKLF